MAISATERVLQLREILYEQTDEEHELSIEELITKLKIRNGTDYKVDKRALKRDIDALNDSGFEVMENIGEKGKKLYSHQIRLFETYQLRLLSDAVLSALFITDEEKERMIKKLNQLTSKHMAKSLPNPLFYSQSSNLDYNQIKFNIDKIHTAISENRHLKYQYGTYNVKKDFVLHRAGEWYDVQPYALIWHRDYYYLIGYFMKTGELRHYRVDRMRNVDVTDQHFKRKSLDIKEYVGNTFQMFAGEEQRIKIQFHQDLINPVLDRFGLDADIKPLNHETFLLTTKASVSDGLIGWILNWGSKAKVMAPESLVTKVQEEAEKLYQLYQD